MASLNISRDDLPESQGYDPVPDGWYNAQIKGAELKPTKANDGQYIAVQYSITGPTHAGRVIFGNLNIKNKNPEAERIGLQQLGEVMGSIGIAKIQDTDQLIGGVLQIKVALSKKQEGFDQRNEVRGFKAIEGSAPPLPRSQGVAPVASGIPAPPWAKPST
jgi:hypothetical protein